MKLIILAVLALTVVYVWQDQPKTCTTEFDSWTLKQITVCK